MEDPFRYLTRLSCHPNLRDNHYYTRVLWDNNLLPALFTVASLGFVKRTKDQRRKDMSSPPLLICRPQRSIETIASFDQWSGTIENH